MNRLRSDHGVAALELSFFFLVLFALIALAMPLFTLVRTELRLQRAAGEAARFATQVPDRTHPTYWNSGTFTQERRPTIAEVQKDAEAAFAQSDGASLVGSPTVSADPSTSLPGTPISVQMKAKVDLGVFGGLLAVIGAKAGTVTLTATSEQVME